jgi:hypothetical protein
MKVEFRRTTHQGVVGILTLGSANSLTLMLGDTRRRRRSRTLSLRTGGRIGVAQR